MIRRLLLGLPALVAAGLLLTGCFTDRQHEGARLYQQNCSNCHGSQGEGLQRLIPPLAVSDYVALNRPGLACLVRRGIQGPLVVNGVRYQQLMPGNEELTDSQITNLLNFVQASWGNKGEVFTIREVSEQLQACGGSDGQ